MIALAADHETVNGSRPSQSRTADGGRQVDKRSRPLVTSIQPVSSQVWVRVKVSNTPLEDDRLHRHFGLFLLFRRSLPRYQPGLTSGPLCGGSHRLHRTGGLVGIGNTALLTGVAS